MVIEGESVKIFATIPLPNKIHEREMDPTSPRLRRAGKTDIPGTFSARGGSALGGDATGATLGPINKTNMKRIWNKHKLNTPLKRKVFVAMSGGVDSSVAAGLLKERGYEVVGIHLRCWGGSLSSRPGVNSSPGFGRNCAEHDAEDARRAAGALKIPFYVFDFEDEYRKRVVGYMIDGYREGITPNPDVMCNKEIKFGIFFEKAMAMGADYVATGHYIRLREKLTKRKNSISSSRSSRPAARSVVLADLPLENGKRADHAKSATGLSENRIFSLHIARDQDKDQSYFLWILTQAQLAHCLFPIGDYIKKTDVRRLAKKFNLPNAEKKDSQGICFLGKVTMADFLKIYIPERKGAVVNYSGHVIGEHKGAQFYTIGQRQGLGIGGSEKPLYIAEKDVRKNIIKVVEGSNDPVLYRKEIKLAGVNFINPHLKNKNLKINVYARVRYRQPLAKAVLESSETGYSLVFQTPQKFVAPGQSAVFYLKSGEMLGGGVIA